MQILCAGQIVQLLYAILSLSLSLSHFGVNSK